MLVYKWSEDVKIVEGYFRSCIYDLTRKEYHLVPKNINKFIKSIENKTLTELNFINDEKDWIDFFLEREFLILIPNSHFKFFSKLSLVWDSPSVITNCILEKNKNEKLCLLLIDQLICKHLIYNCDSDVGLTDFLETNFNVSNLQSLDIYIQNCNLKQVDELIQSFPIIGGIFYNLDKSFGYTEVSKNLIPFKDSRNSIVFNVDIRQFTESQSHNTYFNGKLFIGKNSEIKNSPESKKIYGYILDLQNIDEFYQKIKSSEFQTLWRIHKEMIDVCKDCEFRHMCIDNRLLYNRKNKGWYHKVECEYNPYIAKWKGEEGYKTLNECGVFSDENGFTIDHKKIEEINQELWGE